VDRWQAAPLVRVPAAAWQAEHARHSRRIVPLVGVVYAAALVACTGVLLRGASYAEWLAVGGTAVTLLATALVAAPLHGRLGPGPDPVLLRRLLAADRVRAAGAVVALAGALLGALA
jgi:hypothetical protein